MSRPLFCGWVVSSVALALAGAVAAQEGVVDVTRGRELFRERCAECHGADARGVAGHDLTRLWAAGATDGRVLQTIRNGVPNTIMPSSTAPEDDLRALVAYLRSLNGSGDGATVRGNAAGGERIFSSMCARCHVVDGRGGRLGPELTAIARSQSRDALTTAIRDPNAAAAAGYQTATLVTREGQRIRGTIKGEDAFSIQLMDTNERLQGYLKSRLREVTHEPGSLMPAFGADRLSASDLDDLLQYLSGK